MRKNLQTFKVHKTSNSMPKGVKIAINSNVMDGVCYGQSDMGDV